MKNSRYPISDYVAYLSENFRTFVAKIDEIQVPRHVHETFKDLNWKRVVLEVMKALNDNETWDMVKLPKGKKTVGSEV